MRQTNANSLLVWSESVQPNLTAREVQVFEVIEELFPTTLEDIARNLGVPEHSISGRITGLKKKKLIKVVGRQRNSRMNQVDVYAPRKLSVEYDG